MDNEGNASADTGTSGTTATPEKKSSSIKAPTTPRTKSANASKRSRTGRRLKFKMPVAIWVAVIGSVTTIVTTVVLALPNLLPFIPVAPPSPTTTFTQTPTDVDKTTLFITDTLTLTIFPQRHLRRLLPLHQLPQQRYNLRRHPYSSCAWLPIKPQEGHL